jgi:hypothetical protein
MLQENNIDLQSIKYLISEFMKKIRIKIGIIGYLPFEFNSKILKKWKSNVFEISNEIDKYHFNTVNSDS